MGTQGDAGLTMADDSAKGTAAVDKERFTPLLRLVGLEIPEPALRAFARSFEKHEITVVIDSPASEAANGPGFVKACAVALSGNGMKALKRFPEFAAGHGLTFGIGSESQVLSFRDLQLSVLIDECTETTIRAAVDKTAPFLRRDATMYDRIPLATAASLDTGTVSLNAFTVNVGCGGMAVRLRRAADLPARVRVAWTLPGSNPISLDATPRWTSGRTVGLQYVTTAPAPLNDWIRTYSSRLRITSVT